MIIIFIIDIKSPKTRSTIKLIFKIAYNFIKKKVKLNLIFIILLI